MVLKPFSHNAWYFPNHKTLELEKRLSSKDREIFGFTPFFDSNLDELLDYFINCYVQIDKDLLNVKHDMNNNAKHLWR